MYISKVFLINIRDIQKWAVARLARRRTLGFVDFVQQFRTTLLEQLAVRVVVFKGDAILFHDVVVHKLR